MFTGIIKEIGIVKTIKEEAGGLTITIHAPEINAGLSLGDSVAVNGICLTVVNRSNYEFTMEATIETVKTTNLAKLIIGKKVNLEPALRLHEPLGGHIVTGHIDTLGKITKKYMTGKATILEIAIPPSFHKYLITKGSIAIDGISLTIAEENSEGVKVVIIPHTSMVTTLLSNQVGDMVNIECDCIGKYVESLLNTESNRPPKAEFSWESLRENDF